MKNKIKSTKLIGDCPCLERGKAFPHSFHIWCLNPPPPLCWVFCLLVCLLGDYRHWERSGNVMVYALCSVLSLQVEWPFGRARSVMTRSVLCGTFLPIYLDLYRPVYCIQTTVMHTVGRWISSLATQSMNVPTFIGPRPMGIPNWLYILLGIGRFVRTYVAGSELLGREGMGNASNRVGRLTCFVCILRCHTTPWCLTLVYVSTEYHTLI